MEEMIYNENDQQELIQSTNDREIDLLLKGHGGDRGVLSKDGRKIISRGPRGNFQGHMGDHHNLRLTKGDYAQMLKSMSYDHNSIVQNPDKGVRINKSDNL